MSYNAQEQAVIDTVNYYIAGVESKKDAKENIEKLSTLAPTFTLSEQTEH